MMNTKGFTLIELLVVVTIIGVLSLLLGSSLQGSVGSSRIESEVKEMYSDLMQGRARAIHRDHIYFVQINAGPGTYQITEDTDDDGTISVGDTTLFSAAKSLNDPVTWAGGTIQLSTRGVLSPTGTIRFTPGWTGGSTPDYDCLVLSQTMINMGRMNNGGTTCVVR